MYFLKKIYLIIFILALTNFELLVAIKKITIMSTSYKYWLYQNVLILQVISYYF